MTDLFSYQGRRVVVTGGSRGVGAALLDVLAELDVAHVTVLDLNPPSGPHDTFVATDLSDEQSVRAAIGVIDGPVHALFNNAGVADTQPPRTVLSVNYLALRTLSEGLLERMPEGGAIVNTASTAGPRLAQARQGDQRAPRPRRHRRLGGRAGMARRTPVGVRGGPVQLLESGRGALHAAVVATDDATRRAHQHRVPRSDRHAAARRLSRATASDKILDWNIREMAGRPVSPREVASVLAFLGGPAASYVNGVTLEIDGGFFAAMATGQVDYSGRT